MQLTWANRLDLWHDRVTARPWPLLAVAALVTAVQIGPWWYATPDSTSYMSIARTLCSPAGPSNLGNPHLYFSLGYPTLIAPTFLLEERPFLWISILHWLLTLGVLAGAYRWARPWGTTAALAASVLTVVHAIYGISVRRPLSETAFMTAMIWSVLLLDGVRTSERVGRRWACAIGGTLLLTAACLTRPHGIMIIPGFGLALLAAAWGDRRRMLHAVIIAGLVGGTAAGVFFAARRIDDRHAVGKATYTYWDQLLHPVTSDKALVARIPDGFFIQIFDLQRIVVPGMFKARSPGWLLNPNLPIAMVVAVIVCIGWVRMIRTRGDVWSWTFPCYLTLNVMWAADVGTRYTLPIMPVVWAAFWLGLTIIYARASRWFLPLFVLHALVGVAAWWTVDLPRTRELNSQWDAVTTLCAQIDRDHESVGSWELSPEQVQFFRFQLDRPVPSQAAESNPVEMQPDWIITVVDKPNPADYAEQTVAGPYRLLRRTTAAP